MPQELADERFRKALDALRSTNPLAAEWLKKAHDFGIRNEKGWTAIRPGSPEDKAWVSYFSHQGWTPWCVTAAHTRQIKSYTMPTQWPTWLPTDMQ